MSEHDGAAEQHADAEPAGEDTPGLLQEPLVRDGKRERFVSKFKII